MNYCALCSIERIAIDHADTTICRECIYRIHAHLEAHRSYFKSEPELLLCMVCIDNLYAIAETSINPLSRLCKRCLSVLKDRRASNKTPLIELDRKALLGKILPIHTSTIVESCSEGYIIQIEQLTDCGYLFTRKDFGIGHTVDVYDLGIHEGKHVFAPVD